jgi:hypothetical protein
VEEKCTDPCRSFETVVPNLPLQNLYLLFLKLQKSDETLRNLEPKEKKAEIDKRWRDQVLMRSHHLIAKPDKRFLSMILSLFPNKIAVRNL